MKRLLLPILAVLLTLPAFGINQLKHVPAKDVVILWDIHSTLVNPKIGKYIKMGAQAAWHMALCKEGRKVINDHLDQHGKCGGAEIERKLHELAHTYCKKADDALKAGHKHRAKKYLKKAKHLMKLVHLFHNFELNYRHRDGVVSLLNALKAHGYTEHHVASNISTEHYPLIKQKFPELFNDHMVKDGLTVDGSERPMTKKPDHGYFRVAMNTFNSNRDKVLVFVDDKKENVEAARKCGMIGIRIKSVKQLVKALNEEGLDLTYDKRKIRVNGKKRKRICIA